MKNFSINCRGKLIDLSTPKVMGILNLTPDSFSDGGKFNQEKQALLQVEKMIKEGASIIDIGAQSTRPNAQFLTAKEEINRLGSFISKIKKEFSDILISLDTFYGEVVKFGYNEGIDIVNDISAGQFDKEMLNSVAEVGLPYILMHVNPTYEEMHHKTKYDDIIYHINQFFSEKIAYLYDLGIKDIILDPGFGFGKTIEDQHKMIEETQYFSIHNLPILIGISRKSFIYKPLGKTALDIREEMKVLHEKVVKKGANILRVHDVADAYQVINKY